MSQAVASCPVPIGETLSGKYRIERILGEGGMGVVVAAYHLELEQPVAIKFLLETMADREEGAERFRREARAAAKIHSDHVVRVLDVGVMSDGIRYMVMEYLEGRDLAEEILSGPIPLGVACGYILEAIDAVSHAHAVGIVHRDLKPANLFLAKRHDGAQRVKVLDFGISKTMGASTSEQLSLTKTSAWIGSPLYMAPEQMQSARDVDARADIWSLGAILYELLVGAPPYEAESLPQLCNLLITTDAVPVQIKNPQIPSDLADAIMGCLVRDRDKRISSVGELGRVVARYATTITGSGMYRSSLFERPDQLGDVVGANSPRLSYGGPQLSYGGPQLSSPQMTGSVPGAGSVPVAGSVPGAGYVPVAGNAPSVPAFNPYSRQTPTDRDPHPLAGGRTAPFSGAPAHSGAPDIPAAPAVSGPPTVSGAPDFSGAPFAPGQPGISSSTTLASETPNTRPGSGAGVHAAWGATDAGQKKRGLHPLVWVGAGAAAILGLSLLLFNRQSAEVGDATSASQLTTTPASAQRDLVPESALPAEAPASAGPTEAAKAQPADDAATPSAKGPAPVTAPKKTAKTNYNKPKATPKSQPRATTTATIQAAEPAEKETKPAQKSSDEFSEFGGRR